MKTLHSNNNCKLYVSPIVSTLNEFSHFFGSNTETIVNQAQRKFSSQHRQNEWLTVRALLYKIFNKPISIAYDKAGKPHIENEKINISISHSKNYVAILTSDMPSIGVDIETISPRILRLQHRIMQKSEIPQKYDKFSLLEKQKFLTYLWTIKEAAYKSLKFQDNINILTDIIISSTYPKENPNFFFTFQNHTPQPATCIECDNNICTFVCY